MALKIRLMRIGKKKFPKYRVIVIEEHRKRNSKYLEKVGFYDPIVNPAKLDLDKERIEYWRSKGAQLSEGMQKLIG